MYTRIRTSAVAQYADQLRPQMEKLQSAIKRVSENWNDVVAQGIQSGQINMIIGACNAFNSEVVGMSTSLESDLSKLEELSRITTSTM